MKYVFFTDVHCAPEKDNVSHARALGKFIKRVKPDIVVCGGDLFDLNSLCEHDKDGRTLSQKSYSDDLNAGIIFNEVLFEEVKKSKRKQPYSCFLIGNHEQRIDRFLEKNPEFDGHVSYNDLDLGRFYKEIVPYDGNVPGFFSPENNILFAHYFVSGPSERPLSSVHLAYNLIRKNGVSSIMGHTHLLDFYQETNILGKQLFGLSGGYFCNYDLEYPGYVRNKWWKGFCYFETDGNGNLEKIEFITLNKLMEEVGM